MGHFAAILLFSALPAAAQPWVAVGAPSGNGAIGYLDAGPAAGRNAAIFYGGYTARAADTRGWLKAARAAALARLGIRHLYAVPGPVDAGYARREVANTKLLQHLQQRTPRPNLIVVAAHSSGSYVAHELLAYLLSRAPNHLRRAVYYNLDGGSTLLTTAVARALGGIYFVYAHDRKTRLLSQNATYAQKMARWWPPKSVAIAVDATGSGCRKPWCLHDAVITTRPHNPDKFDLARDYTIFDGSRRVVTDYFAKTWSLLGRLSSGR